MGHRSKDPAETPRNDPIALKCSRPADPVQDPDPAESSVARPKGSAGAALLLAAAVVQDVDESTNDMVTPEGPGEATVIAGIDQPEKAEQKKKRKQKRSEFYKEKRRSKTSAPSPPPHRRRVAQSANSEHLVDAHTSGRGFLIKRALPEALRKKPSHQEGSPGGPSCIVFGFLPRRPSEEHAVGQLDIQSQPYEGLNSKCLARIYANKNYTTSGGSGP